MPESEPKKVDTREKRIFELLRYCEELAAQKIALRRVLEKKVHRTTWREMYARELQETQSSLDNAFHVLHAYLRERDWQGLRSNLRQVLGKLVDDED